MDLALYASIFKDLIDVNVQPNSYLEVLLKLDVNGPLLMFLVYLISIALSTQFVRREYADASLAIKLKILTVSVSYFVFI